MYMLVKRYLLKCTYVYLIGLVRNREVATLQFNFTFDMPQLDRRTRGYLPKYIKELQESVGDEW
jgi:hypothetical protein